MSNYDFYYCLTFVVLSENITIFCGTVDEHRINIVFDQNNKRPFLRETVLTPQTMRNACDVILSADDRNNDVRVTRNERGPFTFEFRTSVTYVRRYFVRPIPPRSIRHVALSSTAAIIICARQQYYKVSSIIVVRLLFA